MFTQFRARYPQGSLVTELSAIDHGKYIVRCLVQVEGTTLVTGLAAAETVELAEDQARKRALAVLDVDTTIVTEEKKTPLVSSEVPLSSNPTPMSSTSFSSISRGQTPPTRFSDAVARATDTSDFSFSESRREEVADYAATTPAIADEIPFTDELPTAPVESEAEVEVPLSRGEQVSTPQLNEAPVTSYSANEVEMEATQTGTSATASPIDFSDIIARTNIELKRLGWTNQQGRDYLLQTYGKRSRQLLTDDELLDFLHHLESQPAPE
jgi:hypothetical protein